MNDIEWHTWNVGLWLNNSEPMYMACMRIANRALSLTEAADSIRDFVEMIELTGDGFDPELVDWEEVAEDFYTELEQ
jgi:hypothetical protein